MAYDARQVANWFIMRARRDGRVLTIMSILKLTYIAHGMHLAEKGEPLFRNEIQAWRYGPVIVDVYRASRKQGMKISEILSGKPDIEGSAVIQLLEKVWNKYSNRTSSELSKLTHIPGGPWDLARKIGGWNAPIPDGLILQHYFAKADRGGKACRFEDKDSDKVRDGVSLGANVAGQGDV